MYGISPKDTALMSIPYWRKNELVSDIVESDGMLLIPIVDG